TVIVLPAAGRHLGAWWRPAVVNTVLRQSPVPVVAFRTADLPSRRLFDGVIVPHDGSRAASRAISTLALLVPPRESRLTLFGVVPTHGPREQPDRRARPLGRVNVVERILDVQAAELRRKLEAVAARARAVGFDVNVAIDIGDPVGKLLDRVEPRGAATLIA